jgi:hypothetical protein
LTAQAHCEPRAAGSESASEVLLRSWHRSLLGFAGDVVVQRQQPPPLVFGQARLELAQAVRICVEGEPARYGLELASDPPVARRTH